MLIEGKSCVVTGAGSGIGAALAHRLADMGAKVCVSDLDKDKAEAVASAIGGIANVCDVRDEAQINALVSQATAEQGEIDLFVSNAGLGGANPDHAASQTNANWQLNWEVHVMAHVYASRALLPDMIRRGSGYLVNVASAAGLLNQIGDSAYSATKHAAVSFAESLAISHGHEGIGVSVVCPQYVATPLLGLSDVDAAAQASLLTADDVAVAIAKGIEDQQFLILSHPEVQNYAMHRAQNHDRWIDGMRMLRAKAVDTFGGVEIENFYKLV
ncbi:Oxidoreductase, short chain dehydrogenase/reductase family protein [Sulfitobacter noctilucicola]|uniref:NAD(P)-dependent dehydrogenase (Short-subunit alcohol dehydrogenase family) n=1 Tax=Sulfitobacter noctilucicola TaxID=1342301 RepID=A0A7W6M5R9_9RHOB|nr:SDR family oxidoreductase [Sulfitobacter noctilucicola]KIN62807.1 Oxidoreductase, short chain dehydrogenase/reductase family protein [Sulfitobacter noctilucicola]MBB4172662.1 NAD(P)-dependent dehydrogenase (short-subunit alcohol dehydrogenase family) [Sulfitobacter noctilucicola]